MMWHFYEIPYIPDLELVKYQSLGEQGIDGILERHNRFLRQWQRNTVLIHTTLHFFLSYTHERPKGSRLQIFLAFSSDQTVNFESIDALMQASPLADYYKIAPIEDVPVCLRKSCTNILLVKKQEQTRLSTGDTLFTVEGWKSNPKSRLYEMEKTAEALNEDMVYHISIYGSDTYKTAQQALQKLDELKQQKKSLMDAGLALDSSNLDSAVQATLMESINDSLRDVENKAYDVSKDANQNLQSLEQIRQNVDDEITDSQKAKKKLDQTKKLLDTLGVGKSLEKGVNKLDDHLQEATGLKGEVISAMQDLEKVYRQLDQI